jgi:hypothetical protein
MRPFSCIILLLTLLAGINGSRGQSPEEGSYITGSGVPGTLTIVSAGKAAPIWISPLEHAGVVHAIMDLQSDIGRVTAIWPDLVEIPDGPFAGAAGTSAGIILAGTVGVNPLIDQLVDNQLLDVSEVEGKWEASLTTVIENPFPGVSRALVIAGSDKRGTIFGIYECSRQIGVSPWYYWADVTPAHRDEIHAIPGSYLLDEPAVKYRGIFINDEAPALAGWAEENFGGFNHGFYVRVFELILRMKGNYLWPAMWGRAFYDDDTLNARLADEYGIVIGTTHHEPLMRAHVEWARYGNGPWDYSRNADTLRKFWREGMERMGNNESIVSLGMRGDGDAPMTQGTAIALLEGIVADQRTIIEEVTGKDAAETPQLWALYKEVQDYYDQGMRVPDDVTLLLCDDNWGNLRKLPQPGEPERKGGYGIYYHFDYVGGPRNYKWLNTVQIERVWEQMRMAYGYGVDRIWIVNVGDIKPMEFPIQFFLDLAWNPEQWDAGELPGYYTLWARQQFGPEHAEEIGNMLKMYTKFNARRKPELLSPDTYSLVHFREADRVTEDYTALAMEALSLYEEIPDALRDAYYQLVLFPIEACANLNALYVSAAKNRLYAAQGRASANLMAENVRQLFRTDADLTDAYHHAVAGGKWNHMMSQTHIGYTTWQQPEQNNMPEVIQITVPRKARMGIALEGSDQSWPGSGEEPVLPLFDAAGDRDHFVEVFNRGGTPFKCTVNPAETWIIPESMRFTVNGDRRIYFRVDWKMVPEGMHRVPVQFKGAGKKVIICAEVDNRRIDPDAMAKGTFIESGGLVSMEASHFSHASGSGDLRWEVVPNLGRTGSSVISVPFTALPSEPGKGSPKLEYGFYAMDTGPVVIRTTLSPTLNFPNREGLRFALSLDDGEPVVVNMHDPDNPGVWNRWVADNAIVKSTDLHIAEPGMHTLSFWRMDAGVVLQKIVILTTGGSEADCYLGPPESPRISP